MMTKEIKEIINQLKSYEIRVQDVPEEIQFDMNIIKAERKFGLRKSHNKGFDVIRQEFFVEEEIFYKNLMGEMNSCIRKSVFEDFESYYNFLEGNIYEDACYRFYDFTESIDFIKKNKVDTERMKEKDSFIISTIDDFTIEVSQEELEEYEEAEKTKALCKKWIAKFDGCKSYEEFFKTVQSYKKSKIRNTVDLRFFIFNYIFKDITDKDRFSIIMEYMSTDPYPEGRMIYELCSIYDPDEVVSNYNYSNGAKSTIYKHKRSLKKYVTQLKNKEINFCSHLYFDRKTHFYCERIEESRGYNKICKYFETFSEFIEHCKGNLKACDLSAAIKLEEDFSKYEIDETTKLPLGNTDDLVCTVKKEFKEGKFFVEQQWRNSSGGLIKINDFSTLYFFDFVHFLKGDLSNADLLFCDGLTNIKEVTGIDFSGAKMRSGLCDKFKIEYDELELNRKTIVSFEWAEKNEEETPPVFQSSQEASLIAQGDNVHGLSFGDGWEAKSQRVYYVSDIHLMHRLVNAKCKSKNDAIYVIQNVIDNIVNETGELLLIGGDVASDFTIFKLFITLLRKTLDTRYSKKNVIFILGNHELWGFVGKTIEEITNTYKQLIEESGMYFIQNDLLYKDSSDSFIKISYKQLLETGNKQLREELQSARLVIFGGIAFSGYNTEFNANNGIYRSILDRDGEIKETVKFEKLYCKLIKSIYDKNVIILTHTPMKDWHKSQEYQKEFIYVSGHTHRNSFYDDGEYRIYSDNQIGYHNENLHLKYFLMDNEYDYFSDYEDGIHEISSAQYNEFYRGKNIQMNFTREVNVLYMLKKKGYYCFIHQAKSGSLTILNGGALKRLDWEDVDYYYDNMDEVILTVKKPLEKYLSVQKKVAEEIQKFGGSGYIHGCIIDIDYYNHIYVNPVDMTITSYWALDMINKFVYPDVPTLLQKRCPTLYANYMKLIKGDTDNQLFPRKEVKNQLELSPKKYLNTDIYKASREIKKMQKLTSNILSSWYENVAEMNSLLNSNLLDKK